jgi:hypothetical protein
MGDGVGFGAIPFLFVVEFDGACAGGRFLRRASWLSSRRRPGSSDLGFFLCVNARMLACAAGVPSVCRRPGHFLLAQEKVTKENSPRSRCSTGYARRGVSWGRAFRRGSCPGEKESASMPIPLRAFSSPAHSPPTGPRRAARVARTFQKAKPKSQSKAKNNSNSKSHDDAATCAPFRRNTPAPSPCNARRALLFALCSLLFALCSLLFALCSSLLLFALCSSLFALALCSSLLLFALALRSCSSLLLFALALRSCSSLLLFALALHPCSSLLGPLGPGGGMEE